MILNGTKQNIHNRWCYSNRFTERRKIKYYVRKINNTETGEITEMYCDKIEEIIKKKYNVDVVLYGDFTVTKEMLCF